MDNAFGRSKENLQASIRDHDILTSTIPFVISTEAEIIQAIKDYRNGRMSFIDF